MLAAPVPSASFGGAYPLGLSIFTLWLRNPPLMVGGLLLALLLQF